MSEPSKIKSPEEPELVVKCAVVASVHKCKSSSIPEKWTIRITPPEPENITNKSRTITPMDKTVV